MAQVRARFTEKSVVALGITQARWVHDNYRSKPRLKDADLDVLVEQGQLLRVAVEGWQAPAYVHASQSSLLKKALANKLEATHSTLLSPFDPIVWDRERALTIYPWICGRCAREFTRANLRELTVHHRDHNHNNNPADGSNWELLCLYCHDNEHQRQLEAAGGASVTGSTVSGAASHSPFANLRSMLNRKG